MDKYNDKLQASHCNYSFTSAASILSYKQKNNGDEAY